MPIEQGTNVYIHQSVRAYGKNRVGDDGIVLEDVILGYPTTDILLDVSARRIAAEYLDYSGTVIANNAVIRSHCHLLPQRDRRASRAYRAPRHGARKLPDRRSRHDRLQRGDRQQLPDRQPCQHPVERLYSDRNRNRRLCLPRPQQRDPQRSLPDPRGFAARPSGSRARRHHRRQRHDPPGESGSGRGALSQPAPWSPRTCRPGRSPSAARPGSAIFPSVSVI